MSGGRRTSSVCLVDEDVTVMGGEHDGDGARLLRDDMDTEIWISLSEESAEEAEAECDEIPEDSFSSFDETQLMASGTHRS